jgi:heme-degrading monooxygenase HmoA
MKGEKLMYARIVTVQVQPDKIEEAISIFQNSVIPAAKQQKGFISLMLLTDTDRSTGKGISVGLWETEVDLKASEASGYLQEQLAKFGGVFAAPPVQEAYEVSVHS